jgi:hypothetical protein
MANLAMAATLAGQDKLNALFGAGTSPVWRTP